MGVYEESLVRAEILEGLMQVDETFEITSFSCLFDRETREMRVNFTAKTKNGEEIEVGNTWG